MLHEYLCVTGRQTHTTHTHHTQKNKPPLSPKYFGDGLAPGARNFRVDSWGQGNHFTSIRVRWTEILNDNRKNPALANTVCSLLVHCHFAEILQSALCFLGQWNSTIFPEEAVPRPTAADWGRLACRPQLGSRLAYSGCQSGWTDVNWWRGTAVTWTGYLAWRTSWICTT